MRIPLAILIAAALSPATHSRAADEPAGKPGDRNAVDKQIDMLLEPIKKRPGLIVSSIGVTRKGTRIPCVVTKDDVDYATKKHRILYVGGMDGSKDSVDCVIALIEWFYTSDAAAEMRKRISLSAVPVVFPDAWAAGKTVERKPGAKYPPKGPYYGTRTDPELAYLWRWIGMHAPNGVHFLSEEPAKDFAAAVRENRIAGVGKTGFAGAGPTDRSTKEFVRETAQYLDTVNALLGILEESPAEEKSGVFSSARRELQKRIARSPRQVAGQLAKRYGKDLNSVVYIPAVALIGRMRLGELTGDASHRNDVEKIVAPYVDGKKEPLGPRVSGSHLSGHLIFSELARTEKDPAKRRRYVELAKAAADLGFEDDGKPKQAMPHHSEMSDAVFMGGADPRAGRPAHRRQEISRHGRSAHPVHVEAQSPRGRAASPFAAG